MFWSLNEFSASIVIEERPNNEASFKVCVIRSDRKQIFLPKRAVARELERHHYQQEAMFAIRLALEEALSNAVRHGNRNDLSKTVTVRYSVTDDQATIVIRDQGCGFAPDKIPDPTTPERLRIPNGRGIMLIRAYMDEVDFRDEGREIRVVKRKR